MNFAGLSGKSSFLALGTFPDQNGSFKQPGNQHTLKPKLSARGSVKSMMIKVSWCKC